MKHTQEGTENLTRFRLSCSDCIQAMEREIITVTAASLDEAWDKAKTKFARKYHTKRAYVNISGIERLD